ncbi:MAG TPA: alanine racemase [Acidimicrobiales bacterium]|nr:alanine racemase [Acidimicrobiales bacterium]
MTRARMRPAWAEIDLDAVAGNAASLVALVAPARLCAVVKADGYGHGAVEVARAATAGGAEWLAVALVEEGLELRQAGIGAPILVLSEAPPSALPDAVGAGLALTVYTAAGIAEAAGEGGRLARRVPVHLKVDTGMHRVGADPADAPALAGRIASEPALRFEGLWTHLAVADEPDDPFTGEQLARFDKVRAELAGRGLVPEMVHAANSGGALLHPAARLDLVRCGISLYGYPPAPGLAGGADLTPVLGLKAEVTLVRRLAAGERLSYGLRRPLPADSVVATVPLGYADGVVRALARAGAEVLVGGRRCPIAGTVTMDQLMVDCGPDAAVQPGDEVVLLGRQGSESVTAEEWARLLGTISYEVLCGVGPRVDRRYTGGPAPS